MRTTKRLVAAAYVSSASASTIGADVFLIIGQSNVVAAGADTGAITADAEAMQRITTTASGLTVLEYDRGNKLRWGSLLNFVRDGFPQGHFSPSFRDHDDYTREGLNGGNSSAYHFGPEVWTGVRLREWQPTGRSVRVVKDFKIAKLCTPQCPGASFCPSTYPFASNHTYVMPTAAQSAIGDTCWCDPTESVCCDYSGSWSASYTGSQSHYQSLLRNLRDEIMRPGDRLRAVLWMHGEADARCGTLTDPAATGPKKAAGDIFCDGACAAEYPAQMTALIKALRADTRQYQDESDPTFPDLPFFLLEQWPGQGACYVAKNQYGDVIEAGKRAAAASLPHVAYLPISWANTSDPNYMTVWCNYSHVAGERYFAQIEKGTHFDPPGVILTGERYVCEYRKMLGALRNTSDARCAMVHRTPATAAAPLTQQLTAVCVCPSTTSSEHEALRGRRQRRMRRAARRHRLGHRGTSSGGEALAEDPDGLM